MNIQVYKLSIRISGSNELERIRCEIKREKSFILLSSEVMNGMIMDYFVKLESLELFSLWY